MLTGFSKIVEQRILQAQSKGDFENLPGRGEPVSLTEDQGVPEDLRMAYKMLKNAECLPPELELRNEIKTTEALLTNMEDTAQKVRTLKKLNLLILKLNASRNASIEFDVPQRYLDGVVERLERPKNAK